MQTTDIPKGYRSTPQIEAHLRALAVAHGGAWDEIGKSVEDRTIRGLRIPGRGSGARVLLLSAVHPMEWIGREVVVDLIEHAVGDRERPEIWAVPTVNPDGVWRVEEALRTGRPRWVRGNARGVDLNRNFGLGHRTRPRWQNFWPLWNPGPGPLSEPESRAIATWAARAPSFDLVLSLHSFGRWVFYPPSDVRDEPAWGRAHRDCVERVRASVTWPPGYRSVQLGRWARWFRARGTEIDHLRDQCGGLAFLVEVSGGGFARWGWRRLLDPFFAFNPPEPEREVGVLRDLLRALVAESARCGNDSVGPD